MDEKIKAAETDKKLAVDDELTHPTDCGWKSFRPKLLQKFNNPKFMTFILCVFFFTQGFVVNGLYNVNVSTLERRFHLSSTRVGLVASIYDLIAALFGLIIGYIGSGKYKARWLTRGATCMVVGSVIMLLPHITSGRYIWGDENTGLCLDDSGNNTLPKTPSLKCSPSYLKDYIWVFGLGKVLYGIGGATLYILGIAYVDDSVPETSSPFYMGLCFTFACIGPGFGFLFGGYILNNYFVDFKSVDQKSLAIDRNDDRWVGAWWVGYIVAAVMFSIVALAMSFFGSELPTAKSVRKGRISQKHKGTGHERTIHLQRPALNEIPSVLKTLFKNPPFVCTTFASIFEALYFNGLSTFVSKFIQNMFHVSAGKAGMLSGATALFGLSGGIFFGGFVCRHFKLKVAGMLKFSFACTAVSMLCVSMMLVSCGQDDIYGIQPDTSYRTKISPYDRCLQTCGCSPCQYNLVCDKIGRKFISQCHAGCRSSSAESKVFTNCSCVLGTNGSDVLQTVTTENCQTPCGRLYVFMSLMFLFAFTSVSASVPSDQAALRSVDENHRSLMIGTTRFMTRILGTFPGSIIMGALADAGCILWKTECGKNISCLSYNNVVIGRNYFITGVLTKIASLVCFFLAVYFYRPPRNRDRAHRGSEKLSSGIVLLEDETQSRTWT